MEIVIGLVVILVLGFLYYIRLNNKIVSLEETVENAWSDIDVQLRMRFDLVDNLVETVKWYAKHEKDTFKEVIEARNKFATATDVKSKAEADNMLTTSLKSLFALSEAYPELKANENFLALQNDLKDTEDKITYARQFYNDSAMGFNNLVQMFPSNIVASMFGFKKFEYFKAEEKEKEVPKVEF